MLNDTITFFLPDFENPNELPYISSGIKAGFPSPAADFDESKISLDNVLVKNREATFYAKASGTSMIGAGIDDGDILVIDRSIEPQNNKVAVCYIDGEFKLSNLSWINLNNYFFRSACKIFITESTLRNCQSTTKGY